MLSAIYYLLGYAVCLIGLLVFTFFGEDSQKPMNQRYTGYVMIAGLDLAFIMLAADKPVLLAFVVLVTVAQLSVVMVPIITRCLYHPYTYYWLRQQDHQHTDKVSKH